MNEERNTAKKPHGLILENRKELSLSGVMDVDSFDDQAVVAYTDIGELTVKGTNLHISKLNLETGELSLTGEISAMIYTNNQPTGNTGLFSRLFR